MLKQKASLESVSVQAKETESIAQLDHILSLEPAQARLVGSNGEEVQIPDSVYQTLRHIVHLMASGQRISLVPHSCELTTQEAAEILNVSRPFFIKLLEQGEIPYVKVGSHRRIRFEDLMTYKQQRDSKRSQLLDQLIQMTEEAGLYEA